MISSKNPTMRLVRIIVIAIPLLFFLVAALFPFYWMVVTSFKSMAEFYSLEQPFYPLHPTWLNFKLLLTETKFIRWFGNSLFICSLTTLLSVFLGSLAGYAIARLNFPHKALVGRGILATYLVPKALLFIPLFGIVTGLRLYNSMSALIVMYPTFAIPFCTWILSGYFRTIPREIEESARVDGASRLQSLFKVVYPLAIPGLISAAVFTFTLSYNDFIYALVFISRDASKTIPVGVAALEKGDLLEWGRLMAAAQIATIPVVIVYVSLLRFFVRGLTAGAVKQ